MITVIGIDPGLTGSVAVYCGAEWTLRLMPTYILKTTRKTKKGNHKIKNVQDRVGVKKIMKSIEHPCFCVIEKQHTKPFQSITSAFTTGGGYDALCQALTDFEIPFEEKTAKAWQGEFGILGAKGDTKEQARHMCEKLFPALDLRGSPTSRVPHKGHVDAVLICEYARRLHAGALTK